MRPGAHASRLVRAPLELEWVIKVWWIYIVVVVLLAAGIYAFVEVAGFRTRLLTRKSSRTAESMYDNYADSPGKQRRSARRRGGEWRDEESGSSPGQPG